MGRKRMTERQLSAAIVEYAESQGWMVFTISNTKAAGLRSHTGEGFPDLFMIREHVIIAAELKVGDGKLTEAQERWLDAFNAVPGNEYGYHVYGYLWREKHWLGGAVEYALCR